MHCPLSSKVGSMAAAQRRLVVFCGAPDSWRGLEQIANSESIRERFEVVGVVADHRSTRSDPVATVAAAFGIPLLVDHLGAESSRQWIGALRPDYGLILTFGERLPVDVIGLFSGYVLNVHPSDLPKRRGGMALEATILSGESLVLTVHKVTSRLDQGPWLLKSAPVSVSNLDIDIVSRIRWSMTGEIVEAALLLVADDRDHFRAQDESAATYMWRRDTPRHLAVRWALDDPSMILRRALAGGAIVYVEVANEVTQLHLTQMFVVLAEHSHMPGLVLAYDGAVLKVACNGGYLHVTRFERHLGGGRTSIVEMDAIQSQFKSFGQETVAFLSPEEVDRRLNQD